MKPRAQILVEKLRQVALWFDDRLHIKKLFESTAGHHVPKSSGSWFYVFGSGTLLCLMIQIVTGTCLAFVYVPSADEAYSTLEYLTFHQSFGWYLRGVHYWGSNFMVGIMFIHMAQVFLFGAEFTWAYANQLGSRASHGREALPTTREKRSPRHRLARSE